MCSQTEILGLLIPGPPSSPFPSLWEQLGSVQIQTCSGKNLGLLDEQKWSNPMRGPEQGKRQ